MIYEILILVVPLISMVYFKKIKKASLIGAIIEMFLLIPLYFNMSSSGFFFVDHITYIFILMVSSIYLMSLIYSQKYVHNIKNKGISENVYYMLMGFFYVAMEFALMVNNYGFMWVGIETTTISSALLLITEKSDTSLEATWRYIIIVSAGVTFAFISVILIYYQFDTLTMSTILSEPAKDTIAVRLAVAIALVGFGTKVGVFPVHTWLPDAHSEAPAPVSAMFSGVLLPVALYVLFRIYEIFPMRELFVWAGTISVLFAAIVLGYQKNFKRMFAYSTMENMNIALIGFGTFTMTGIIGSLLLLLAHSFGKAGAFYSSGNVYEMSGTKSIDGVSGLIRNRASAASMLLSSFAVTGTPPYGTFFGEFLILYSVFQIHFYAQFVIIVLSLFLAFVSINFNVSKMIFRGKSEYSQSGINTALPLIAAILSIFIGVVFLVVYHAIL